jgi:Na+/H+-dicarboxylate symporter
MSLYNTLRIGRIQPWHRIVVAMLLGLVVGEFVGEPAKALQPLGDVFMSLIRMCVIPVVFVSLVCGIMSLRDLAAMRRIALKSVLIYVVSMGLSAVLAMTVASTFGIGQGFNLSIPTTASTIVASTSLKDALMVAIPGNPFKAFADGALLPTIGFAVFFGLAINLSGDRSESVRKLFEGLSAVVFKLIAMVLKFAPLGVFGLMACVTADHGLSVLGHLGALVAVNYAVLLFFVILASSALLLTFRLNPLPFLSKMLPV